MWKINYPAQLINTYRFTYYAYISIYINIFNTNLFNTFVGLSASLVGFAHGAAAFSFQKEKAPGHPKENGAISDENALHFQLSHETLFRAINRTKMPLPEWARPRFKIY